jgi:hypothetical protein
MRTEILTALIETRRLIDAGWVQWIWEDDKRGYCLVGALKHTCSVSEYVFSVEDYTVYRAAHDRLRAQLPASARRFSLMGWNDELSRTKAEVLDLLDRAIAEMMRGRDSSLAPAVRERELEPA